MVSLFNANRCSLLDSLQILQFHPFISQPRFSTLYLTCNVIRGKPYQILWRKNSVEITADSKVISSERYSIRNEQSMSMFTLDKLDADDSANYSCVVFDQNGQFDQQWSVLQVKGMRFQIFL